MSTNKAKIEKQLLGPKLPKVVESLSEDEKRKQKAAESDPVAPIVRSVSDILCNQLTIILNYTRSSPGFVLGTFHSGTPVMTASGFRDGRQPKQQELVANHIHSQDPFMLGPMTRPVTAMLATLLHDERKLNFDAPLSSVLFELAEVPGVAALTPRNILGNKVRLDTRRIVRDAGGRLPWFGAVPWNAPKVYEKNVWGPLRSFFGSSAADVPSIRDGFVQYLRTSMQRKPFPVRVAAGGGKFFSAPCHFSFALLAAAIDRVVIGKSFEKWVESEIFYKLQVPGGGYGIPSQHRDRGTLFYRKEGLSSAHYGFWESIPPGDERSCAPRLFNASLNLYCPLDYVPRLMIATMDHASRVAPSLIHGNETGSAMTKKSANYCELGYLITEQRSDNAGPLSRYLHARENIIWNSYDFLPWTTSLFYDCSKDLGAVVLFHSGSRRLRWHASRFVKLAADFYFKKIVEPGMPERMSQFPEDSGIGNIHSCAEEKKKKEQEEKIHKYADEDKLKSMFYDDQYRRH